MLFLYIIFSHPHICYTDRDKRFVKWKAAVQRSMHWAESEQEGPAGGWLNIKWVTWKLFKEGIYSWATYFPDKPQRTFQDHESSVRLNSSAVNKLNVQYIKSGKYLIESCIFQWIYVICVFSSATVLSRNLLCSLRSGLVYVCFNLSASLNNCYVLKLFMHW